MTRKAAMRSLVGCTISLFAMSALTAHKGNAASDVLATAGTVTACHSNAALQDMLVTKMRRIVSSAETSSSRLRSAIGIVQMPESLVVIVTDSTTCARASQAARDIASLRGDTLQPNTSVVVARLGATRFAVDALTTIGDYGEVFVFDDHWNHVISITN